jgi:hypothetical protein
MGGCVLGTDERKRLHLLQEALDSGTIRRLEALGSITGWSCPELGAGLGSIARWMAYRAGKNGSVLAKDLDTKFLVELQEPNLRVQRHDITTDGAWARRLPEVLQKHGFTEVHADGEVQFFNGGSPAAELYQLTWLQCRDKLLQQNRL